MRGSSSTSSAVGRVGKGGKRDLQGSALPPDRSRIESYPVGCCVLIETGITGVGADGGVSWYLVAFRIGDGLPHLRSLARHPTDAGWNAGMGAASESRVSVLVLASQWPTRQGSQGVGSEKDPLDAVGDQVGGTLMMGFMGKTRRPAPDLEWISDCGVITPLEYDSSSDLTPGVERKCDICRRPCVQRLCAAPPEIRRAG